MKKKYLFVVALFTSVIGNVNAQSPNWLWAKAMGGVGGDGVSSIAIDAYGNVYTTGGFNGIADFDPGTGVFNLTSAGSNDIFISKLDASGNFIWAKSMGGVNGDGGSSIAIDASGNVYSTGSFYGTADFDPGAGVFNLTPAGAVDIFISKLDSLGNFVWAKSIGGAGNGSQGWSIALDVFDNVYTTGIFNATVDFDPGVGTVNLTSSGGQDIFISKLDSSGNFVWAKRIGGTSSEISYSISIDTYGNIYTSGTFGGTVDFDPGLGVFNLTSLGINIFNSKLDSSGNFVWAKSMGGTGYVYGARIAVDASGNVLTTGAFNAGTVDFDPGVGVFNLTASSYLDIFISKLDVSGNFVWAKAMGGTDDDFGQTIAHDASGNIYTAGHFSGTADFDPGVGIFNLTSIGFSDIFISKLDTSGNFAWAKAAGGTNYDYGNAITLDGSGHVYVAGWFTSPSIAFGSTTLTNASANPTQDIFIAKIDTALVTGNNEIENFDDGILLFPNPAANHLTITLKSNNKKVKISIMDISGRIIYKTTAIETQKIDVNTGQFAEGVYVVQINAAEFIETKRFIVAK